MTGNQFLEFIPMRRGFSPIRVPLDALRDLRITDERFKPPTGPADALLDPRITDERLKSPTGPADA